MRFPLFVTLGLLAAVGFSKGAEARAVNLLDDDLTQWESLGKARWRVEGGVLIGGQDGDASRSGLLVSKKTYRDFDLRFDYLLDEHGKYNSGVYFRRAAKKADRLGPSYQLNLGRGVAGEYVGLYLSDWLDKGDEKDEIRKPREWNAVRLLVSGVRIRAWLNDVLIVDYLDPAPRADLRRAGVLAFQTYGAEGHAGWVKFRNVILRELVLDAKPSSRKDAP